MAIEITVRGSHSVFTAPERAVVHATLSYEGPEMPPVYERIARDLESVKASLTPLTEGHPAAVARWSAEQLRTWSQRPWNKDGKRLPLVHHASVAVTVEFSDFAALSAWTGAHVAGTEGFRVARVSWELTDARRDELLGEVRHLAVRDAVTRAQQYADALDVGTVRPLAVADPGMLSDTSGPTAGGPSEHPVRAAAHAAPAPDVELVPRDLELSATVDARFAAGP
ncbi:SIMPL domain-containing protein [Mycobacterium sp. Y57]|uniref:SIMPL domain-containing protein n=1 Tax=Mycolicibacterium xanthum TaxID=2796469 RepID=UPI001C85D693|nr:SIMPL domain-containing protein [Mycolicibacterium xanthum]MBX7431210.1 SIMPL domain-containing protein [Mycolicibacterium xanthum]